MGAGLALTLISISVYFCGRGVVRRYVGPGALSGALLLLPMALGYALTLLNCEVVNLTHTTTMTLDGGVAYASSTASRTTSAVPLLVADPYACWAGSHRPAAYLSIAVLILCVGALPLLVLWWLRRDPWLVAQLNMRNKENPDGDVTHLAGSCNATDMRRIAQPTTEAEIPSPNATSLSTLTDSTADPCLQPFINDG